MCEIKTVLIVVALLLTATGFCKYQANSEKKVGQHSAYKNSCRKVDLKSDTTKNFYSKSDNTKTILFKITLFTKTFSFKIMLFRKFFFFEIVLSKINFYFKIVLFKNNFFVKIVLFKNNFFFRIVLFKNLFSSSKSCFLKNYSS